MWGSEGMLWAQRGCCGLRGDVYGLRGDVVGSEWMLWAQRGCCGLRGDVVGSEGMLWAQRGCCGLRGDVAYSIISLKHSAVSQLYLWHLRPVSSTDQVKRVNIKSCKLSICIGVYFCQYHGKDIKGKCHLH